MLVKLSVVQHYFFVVTTRLVRDGFAAVLAADFFVGIRLASGFFAAARTGIDFFPDCFQPYLAMKSSTICRA